MLAQSVRHTRRTGANRRNDQHSGERDRRQHQHAERWHRNRRGYFRNDFCCELATGGSDDETDSGLNSNFVQPDRIGITQRTI